MKARLQTDVIFDVLYGFIPIAPWEEEIINSPFYQRLRWIKQLGFANYIFPGAEHNRFAHAIGVMYSMHQMVESLGVGVPENVLFDPSIRTEESRLHRSLRVAALLHDIGTFPFSHVIEYAYLRHGNDSRRTNKKQKALPNSHEHLGSYIIKNTNYDGGITRILEKYDLDIQFISDIIKGTSPHLIANQLMHSDLDADRMDYLMRDSHYTGIKYGQFDREYVLSNLETFEAVDGSVGFGVRESALHAVEDFLIARYSWYSQVIKNQTSAKFDIMSSHVAQAYLEKDLMYQFPDLLEMIDRKNERFFWWNDIYFMNQCQDILFEKKIKDPQINELIRMLLYRVPPKTLRHPEFAHELIPVDHAQEVRERKIDQIEKRVGEFRATLKKYGKGNEWILVDIPQKDVSFTTRPKSGKKARITDGITDRDPIKIIKKNGPPQLLTDGATSLLRQLSRFVYFAPNIYANEAAVEVLKKRKLV